MAKLLKVGAVFAELLEPAGRVFSLKEMYGLLGCWAVEAVHLADGRIMWIDEEGKFTRPEELNHLATSELHRAGGSRSDYIAGPALITERGEVD